MFKCASCIKQGFTLSEVLLVLTVIGVVASLTIPNLIQKVSNDQYKAAWKKNYSVISQAATLILNNEHSGNFSGYISASSPPNKLYNSFMNQLSTLKSCGTGVAAIGNCISAVKELNGTGVNQYLFDDGAFQLSDGTMIALEDANSSPNRPVYIWVDVNGLKPPNTLGKDVFGAKLYNDGIKPFGATGDGWENTCTTTGYGCSAELLYK